MELDIHTPAPPLSSIVESVISYSGYTAPGRVEALLPDAGSQLVIPLDNGPRALVTGQGWRFLDGPWITGVQTRPLHYLGETDASTVCIRFTSSGFLTAFATPLGAVEGDVVAAEDVLGPSVVDLRDRLIEAENGEARMSAIEAFVMADALDRTDERAIAEYVARGIEHGRASLGQLVEKTGYSWRHVIEVFKAHVGVSPKRYGRLVRFSRLVRRIHAESTGTASVPPTDDYFDQPHLIREFREFTGLTPGRYRKVKGSYPHVVPLDSIGQ